MTLSELFGKRSLPLSIKEQNFLGYTRDLWSREIDQIILENRGPKIKTRIIVKKDNANG